MVIRYLIIQWNTVGSPLQIITPIYQIQASYQSIGWIYFLDLNIVNITIDLIKRIFLANFLNKSDGGFGILNTDHEWC